MIDFAAHCTIHAIEIGFQKYYILPVLEGRSSTMLAKVSESPLFPSR